MAQLIYCDIVVKVFSLGFSVMRSEMFIGEQKMRPAILILLCMCVYNNQCFVKLEMVNFVGDIQWMNEQ